MVAELILMTGVGLFVLLGSVVYLPDRKGWHQTFGRMAMIARSSVNARLRPLEAPVKRRELEEFDAALEGKVVAPKATKKQHVIVKKWMTFPTYSSFTYYNWKCSCGATDHSIFKGNARSDFRTHRRSERRRERGQHGW